MGPLSTPYLTRGTFKYPLFDTLSQALLPPSKGSRLGLINHILKPIHTWKHKPLSSFPSRIRSDGLYTTGPIRVIGTEDSDLHSTVLKGRYFVLVAEGTGLEPPLD